MLELNKGRALGVETLAERPLEEEDGEDGAAATISNEIRSLSSSRSTSRIVLERDESARSTSSLAADRARAKFETRRSKSRTVVSYSTSRRLHSL